jgi:hypothetical protein
MVSFTILLFDPAKTAPGIHSKVILHIEIKRILALPGRNPGPQAQLLRRWFDQAPNFKRFSGVTNLLSS